MASKAPLRFWTTLRLSGAKCYVLEPMGKAKLHRQRSILHVIDQWAVHNKSKSIILSKYTPFLHNSMLLWLYLGKNLLS